jgi:putative ABC transport system permease protein
MNTLFQDIRFGLRMLLKHKGFTAVAIIALGLGIGANTAIFSLVNGVLLRPLAYPDPEQIVYVEGRNPPSGITDSNVSFPDYLDWSKLEAFSHLAAFYTASATFSAPNSEPERVPRAGVSSSFFSVLGVQPAIGRAFLAEEDQAKKENVAILSEGLWKRRFGADPKIIGTQVVINSLPRTVVGVMPAGFDFPEGTQVWWSMPIDPQGEARDNRSFSVIGRLKPGAPLQQAQSQVSTINAQLATAFPVTNTGWDANLSQLQERLVRSVRPSLLVLLGAVALVLLIACANVANLLLARAASREKEVAIRTALGASRTRIIRQMLTESLLLSIIGGGLGLFLSVWLTDLLISLNPPDSPRFGEVNLDYRVLAFTIALSGLTGLVFGLVPALQASKLDVSGSLKQGGRTGEGNRRTSARSLLLIGEVALSLMLLVGAGLLIKSFLRLQEVKPGFNPQNVLTASISLPGAKYKENPQRAQFYRNLIERLKALPGIQSVGAGVNLPLGASGYQIGRAYIPEGRPMTTEESRNASFSAITPEYFQALQIPLIAGRGFTDRDTEEAPKVVLINKSMATQSFGSPEAALGKRMTIWRDEQFPREIVGVVGDTKPVALDLEAGAQMYVPHAQDAGWGFMALVIRTAGDPASMAPAVRREVLSIDKDQPIYNVRTMEDMVAQSMGTRRASTLLFAVFAGAALILAAVGIYGVMAYSVTQRTQEIGIRMALGAQAGDVLRLVVRQGMVLTLIGVVVGMAGSLGLAKVIASLLFDVPATDPATFLGIPLLLIFVALIACYLPARRAARLDPTVALAQS